ncbi:hypothetical protein SAMN05216368_101190 [Cryobacterium flavum]|uniref:ABC transporter ATP-binding protein n=1 Tax=Cryobacterium flavum TaxID=1424659 RepID=A0A4R8V7X7_9MICO|nr:hypothetical protein [Cryobacterium flavum]TFB77612.1 hypothetical protein E3O21_07995 [Cryobacterium flavum]SDM51381.1 hypothetical protein SAMN05216368_101190 [Cryobacterium flavum]
MTKKTPGAPNSAHQPSRSDRLKPVELLAISAGMALFVGLTILGTTREVMLSVIGLGVTFIVALVVIAMLVLGMKPNASEQTDLDEQNGH